MTADPFPQPAPTRVGCIIAKVERATNTTEGNPRWRVFTDAGTWLTKIDATVAFGIDPAWCEVPAVIDLENARITDIELVDPTD
jgi:hypothetical protein